MKNVINVGSLIVGVVMCVLFLIAMIPRHGSNDQTYKSSVLKYFAMRYSDFDSRQSLNCVRLICDSDNSLSGVYLQDLKDINSLCDVKFK